MLKDYNYCYMHSVLVQDNKIKAFRFTLGKKLLKDICYYTTDVEGLKSLCEDTALCKDFAIENNFLKCDNVPRVIFTSDDAKCMNQIIQNDDDYLLLDFVEFGAENGFFIIDRTIEPAKGYVGGALTAFSNIEVSQSTMTMYAKIVNDNQLHNEMLVIMTDGQLEISNFHFIKPKAVEFPAWFQPEYVTYLGNATVNNEEYEWYKLNHMPLYSNNFVRASALINKGMALHVKYKNLIETLALYKGVLNDAQGYNISQEPITWAGGTTSYKTPYGVYLKSSMEMWSNKQKSDCVNFYSSLIESCSDCNEISNKIETEVSDAVTRLVLHTIHNITLSDSDMTTVIMNCIQTIQSCKVDLLKIDLFLYRIRICSYVNNIRLAPKYNPILVGSDEVAFTKVNSVFEY